MYWNDEGDPVVSTSMTWRLVNWSSLRTPRRFHKIYYNEQKKSLVNHTKKGCYVKLIVEGKSPAKLNQLVDKLYKVGIHDLKIIENLDVTLDDEVEVEAEDTLTTLTNYVNAIEDDINKESLMDIFVTLVGTRGLMFILTRTGTIESGVYGIGDGWVTRWYSFSLTRTRRLQYSPRGAFKELVVTPTTKDGTERVCVTLDILHHHRTRTCGSTSY